MGKYESLQYWSRRKARVYHRLRKCGVTIGKGEFYYKEKIDSVKPPLVLSSENYVNGVVKTQWELKRRQCPQAIE